MKKYLSALLILTLLLTAAPMTAFAAEAPVQQITAVYNTNGLIIQTTVTVYNTPIQTRAVQSTSASKKVDIKNSTGKMLATFTLHGTFKYDGKNATCTSASYSTSISDSTWSFTSARAWASANKAYGSYKLSCSANGQTVSDQVTITCSPTGKISYKEKT